MYIKLTIPERLKDLRVDRGLTLEQLAAETGLSKSALGKYEADDFKDISPFSIATLAKFYGVSTDYLMGLTETKNHPNTDLHDLHLSDDMITVLKSGKINNRLLCEMGTRLMTDIEIYVDRIADMRINDLNAVLHAVRQQLIAEHNPGENDLNVRTLELGQIDEDDYFSHVIHKDMGQIIRDIREAHRTDATTADVASPAVEAQRQLQEAMQFEGSDQEKQVKALCSQLGIPYDDLTPDEFAGLIAALKKSDILKNTRNLRGKQSPYQPHGKDKRKKKR